MTTTRTISLWGRGLDRAKLPRSITVRGAVAASLERRSGLVICGGPRDEGTALSGGRPSSRHFACTLGRPCRGGGYTPIAEVWWAEPIGEQEG